MLYEDDIVEAVCTDLQKRGFVISQKRLSTERGDDIIASHSSGMELRIEAKGETSAREDSKCFGKAFTRSQVLVHVCQAFYRSAKVLNKKSASQKLRVGVAFPDNEDHRERITAIEDALHQLDVAVFWVKADRSVTISVLSPLPETPFKSQTA